MKSTETIPAAYLSPVQAAQYLGLSRSTVWNLISTGRRTRGQAGLWPIYAPSPRTVRVHVKDLDRWMNARRIDRIMP